MEVDEIKQVAIEFLHRVSEGDFDAAVKHFDATMTGALPAANLRDSWGRLTGQLGVLRKMSEEAVVERDGYLIMTLSCQFERGALDLDLSLNGEGKIAGLNTRLDSSATPYTAPSYVDRATFEEVDVTVGSGRWALPASLCLPRRGGPTPAVLLVHGSGPQDRDETIGPNRLFRDIAWGMASQGIAVLRYDKRTKVHGAQLTPAEVAAMTVQEEVVDDALAAIALLRGDSRIDPQRIYLLGHSLGATLAPRIAEQAGALAGLIILAGMTRPLEETILDQIDYLYRLSGEMSDAQRAEIARLKEKVARVKDPELSARVPAEELPLDIPAAYWLSLRGYDPAVLAASLALPTFVAQGGRDYQVTVDRDLPAWRGALGESDAAQLKVYPALSHEFIAGEGPSTPQDYLIEGHVSEEVIHDICEWIAR